MFDDSNGAVWKSGDAELGAGDGGERAVINIGATNARWPVVYFRKKFTVTNPAQYNSLELEALIDDGAIFYLNGKEIGRMNMPSGAVGYSYTNLSALNEAAFLPVTDARMTGRTIRAETLMMGRAPVEGWPGVCTWTAPSALTRYSTWILGSPGACLCEAPSPLPASASQVPLPEAGDWVQLPGSNPRFKSTVATPGVGL
jgi:hypothetical protein